MESLLAGIAQHGYSILFVAVILETLGVPVPAALALLVAGATSARGDLRPELALAAALVAMLLGDTLMFLMGRYTGWWLLGLLCRVSLNPESCILRSADSFYRRGRTLLLFAKFLPGINTLAPPLAGSMRMRLLQFTGLDLVGATLYIGLWFGLGFACSGLLGKITRGYQAFGRLLGWLVIAAIIIYIAVRVWMWLKVRRLASVPRVHPRDVAKSLYDEESPSRCVVYDVRSHGYYESGAKRIRGSLRIEPHALNQSAGTLPRDQQIILYCTCVREATSVHVARVLREQGLQASVIAGGLRSWRRAGLPLEPVPADEMIALPSFAK